MKERSREIRSQSPGEKKGTLVLFMKNSFSACCDSFQKEKRPGERLYVILEGMPLRDF